MCHWCVIGVYLVCRCRVGAVEAMCTCCVGGVVDGVRVVCVGDVSLVCRRCVPGV